MRKRWFFWGFCVGSTILPASAAIFWAVTEWSNRRD